MNLNLFEIKSQLLRGQHSDLNAVPFVVTSFVKEKVYVLSPNRLLQDWSYLIPIWQFVIWVFIPFDLL